MRMDRESDPDRMDMGVGRPGMTEPSRWWSPLGVSVALFLVIGGLWLFVGALSFPLHRRGAGAQYVFVSARADTAYFGRSPSELVGSDPAFDKLRTMMIAVIAGLLLLAGATFVFVSWFGLRNGSTWALASLSLGGLLAIALWVFALLPYVKAGVRLTLADVPPFMWVPAILLVPATILGWLGLK